MVCIIPVVGDRGSFFSSTTWELLWGLAHIAVKLVVRVVGWSIQCCFLISYNTCYNSLNLELYLLQHNQGLPLLGFVYPGSYALF